LNIDNYPSLVVESLPTPIEITDLDLRVSRAQPGWRVYALRRNAFFAQIITIFEGDQMDLKDLSAYETKQVAQSGIPNILVSPASFLEVQHERKNIK
jgi:hypothetical protein